MPNKNKNLWIIVAVIIVLVLGYYFLRSQSANAPSNETNTQSLSTSGNPTSDSSTTPSTQIIKYVDAQKIYKGKIFQFNNTCGVSPRAMTFTNNTNIMLDNRSSHTRNIKVGSIYTVKPYDFKIVNVYVSSTPKTILIDCDKQQNVATITVQ